jgi:hypothetical protein
MLDALRAPAGRRDLMSLAQRFERRLEGVVGSAFARVFKGQVEPVEIGNALQREASDKHAVMNDGHILTPNRYRVSLGTSDYERLAPWEVQLCNSLAELVQEYLDEQDWSTIGDIEVYLHHDVALHTGVFGVASRMEPEAPPRQRPYDSLSLPVVPGMPPNHYEHPFGTPPPAAAPAYQDPYADPYAQPEPQYHQPPTAYSQPGDIPAPGFPAPGVAVPGFPSPGAPVPGVPAPNVPLPGAPEYGHDPYAAPAAQPPAPQYAPAGQYGGYDPGYGHAPPPAPYYPPQPPPLRGILAIDGAPTHIVLRPGSNVIGRSHDCDLQILDQGVSRRHVDVQFDGHNAVAYDLGSTNGTSVNGHQIGSHQLQHGDVLRVGHTRIVYHQENG